VISPWWAAFEPVETRVGCGPGQHTVLWADGTLHAVEHPDAEGELVLAALGGEATPCLDLVRTWKRHSDDLVVLALAPRSADDLITMTTAEIDELAGRRHSAGRRLPHIARVSQGHFRGGGSFVTGRVSGPAAPQGRVVIGGSPAQLVQEGDQGRHELLRLLALSTPLQLRLSGAVAHAWSPWGPQADRADRARPALSAALAGRAGLAAARWLGVDLPQIEGSLYSGPSWGAIELDTSADYVRLKVALPVSWLAWVWAPGLAVVDGHFVVSVQHAAWPSARVLATSAPGRDLVEKDVRHESGSWSVVRRQA
jgi:hypothetical protein